MHALFRPVQSMAKRIAYWLVLSEGVAGVILFRSRPGAVCCSLALSKISSDWLKVFGVVKLVASENTMMAMAKPHVRRSNKSPVFFTPIRLLAPEPPNWLDKPPPFEFCARMTNTRSTAETRTRLI